MRAGIAQRVFAPFVWGESDCGFVFDIIRDMTGFDAIADIRGYRDERSALRAVRNAGFPSVMALVEARFVEIDPAFAQRGDIGYPSIVPHQLMSPAIIDGANGYSKDLTGGVVVPISHLVRAWAV